MMKCKQHRLPLATERYPLPPVQKTPAAASHSRSPSVHQLPLQTGPNTFIHVRVGSAPLFCCTTKGARFLFACRQTKSAKKDSIFHSKCPPHVWNTTGPCACSQCLLQISLRYINSPSSSLLQYLLGFLFSYQLLFFKVSLRFLFSLLPRLPQPFLFAVLLTHTSPTLAINNNAVRKGHRSRSSCCCRFRSG
ncbi:hypothetical protein BX070DRAFT_37893 [Coemansia spiralis]|nr:hypothetical protein BX070DRAFT_37893 [Coemansia spiralis]